MSPARNQRANGEQQHPTAVSGQIARQYEQRGLKPDLVELEHLRTVETEVKREREVNQSLQQDIAMLQDQVRRAD